MKYKSTSVVTRYLNKIPTIILVLTMFNIRISAQQKLFQINTHNNPLKNFSVPLNKESHPFFVDIDGDGDLDCFVGEDNNGKLAKVYFFRNDGSDKYPLFKEVTGRDNPFNNIIVNSLSIPYFVDINNDGTYDCFVGEGNTGSMVYYKNIGTTSQPKFEKQSAAFNPLSMVKFWASSVANPAFADIDGDGDYDCLVTDEQGNENYFKNIGIATDPVFVHVESSDDPFYQLAPNEGIHNPSFQDWDGDGLVDLFINTDYYKNIGTKTNPIFRQNKDDGPVFQNKLSNKNAFIPLRWVDLKHDKSVEVIQGSPTGNFIYQTLSSKNENIIQSFDASISVFPNPSKHEFILKNLPPSILKTVIRITDVQGNLLKTLSTNNNFITFGSELQTGAYMIEVLRNNKVIYHQKIIKEK
jgi:hypothetical protein